MNEVTVLKGKEKTLYKFNEKDVIYNLSENSKLIVFLHNFNISNNIIINLNGENAQVEFHYSIINYDNNYLNLNVYHNASNTQSNIYNHGINEKNNNLTFNINGKILKKANKCILNQKNTIINLENGKSIINPNLLIDNFDSNSSHSAFIGKFKDEKIFYLMRLGLSENKAIDLLKKGFLLNGANELESSVKEFFEIIDKEENHG